MNKPGVGRWDPGSRQYFEELRREAEKLHKENPQEVSHLYSWTVNLLQLSVLEKAQEAKKNKIDEAIRHLKEALVLNPDYDAGHYMLGHAYSTMASLYHNSWQARVCFDEAVSCYQKARLLNFDPFKLELSLRSAEWGSERNKKFRLPKQHKVDKLLASGPLQPPKLQAETEFIELMRAKKLENDLLKQAMAPGPCTSSTNEGDSTDDLSSVELAAAKAPEQHTEIQKNNSVEQAMTSGPSTSSTGTKAAGTRQYFEELRREAEKLHKENPQEVSHLYFWAVNLLQLSVLEKAQEAKKNKIDEAIRHLKEALLLNPDFDDGHYMLGHAYSTMASLYPNSWKARVCFDEAVSCYKKARLMSFDPFRLGRSLMIAEWGSESNRKFRLPELHKVDKLLASGPRQPPKLQAETEFIELLRAKKLENDLLKQAMAPGPCTSSTNEGDSTDDLSSVELAAAKAPEQHTEIQKNDSVEQAMTSGPSTSSTSTKHGTPRWIVLAIGILAVCLAKSKAPRPTSLMKFSLHNR